MILGKLKETVNIAGQDVPINWGHRTGIAFTESLRTISDDEVADECLRAFYRDRDIKANDPNDLIEKALEFYSYDPDEPFGALEKEEEKRKDEIREEKGLPPKEDEQLLNFTIDAPFIYGAFLSQYGIDLSKEEIHWHKFKALLSCLNDNHRISQIMHYRSIDLHKLDGEERKEYRKIKNYYSLNQPSAEEIAKQKEEEDYLLKLNQGANNV